MEKEKTIKLYYGVSSGGYNKVIPIELTKNELTLVHALLSDCFEKTMSNKYQNALHSYKVDLWEINTIIGIEKEIWNKMKSSESAREIIQTFLDAKHKWMNEHRKDIEEEKNAKI